MTNHKNERTQMRRMRDREFLQQYREEVNRMLAHGEPLVRRTAVNRALQNGKPLFYLSFTRAYNVMLIYKATGDVPLKEGALREMWLEIARNLDETMLANDRLTMPQALARVLATAHASRFFISETYAYKLLYRIVKENRALAQKRIVN